MVYKSLLYILCLYLCACEHYKDNIEFRTTSELVQVLSSDSLEGRYPGTPGFEKAAQYVENYLEELDIKPFFNDSYRDNLSIFDSQSFNIVGVIDSERSSNKYILIGAHLDHLETRSSLSDSIFNGANDNHLGTRSSLSDSIFNGANDNASGVAAVLQIARELKQQKLNMKVIVALFTGEESGLIGSKHLAKRLKDDNINLAYVINFEMIGQPLTLYPNNVYITGYEKSNFAKTINKILQDDFIIYNGAVFSDGLFRADNYPFYLEYNIPSHTISTFDFRNDMNYHSPSDEYSNLNIQHMDFIINKTSIALIDLLQEEI